MLPSFHWLLEIAEVNLCLAFWKQKISWLKFCASSSLLALYPWKTFPPLINRKLRNIEMVLTCLWSFFLKKMCKSVFKQDKYNFTKKIELFMESSVWIRKWQISLCPFIKRINLLNILWQFPTHSSTPPQINFTWAFEKHVNNQTFLFRHFYTCSVTVGLTVFNKIYLICTLYSTGA